MRISIGLIWAAAMMLVGLSMLYVPTILVDALALLPGFAPPMGRHSAFGLALFSLLGAQYVFIFLIADSLCNDMPMMISGWFKLIIAMAAFGSVIWAVWIVVPLFISA